MNEFHNVTHTKDLESWFNMMQADQCAAYIQARYSLAWQTLGFRGQARLRIDGHHKGSAEFDPMDPHAVY